MANPASRRDCTPSAASGATIRRAATRAAPTGFGATIRRPPLARPLRGLARPFDGPRGPYGFGATIRRPPRARPFDGPPQGRPLRGLAQPFGGHHERGHSTGRHKGGPYGVWRDHSAATTSAVPTGFGATIRRAATGAAPTGFGATIRRAATRAAPTGFGATIRRAATRAAPTGFGATIRGPRSLPQTTDTAPTDLRQRDKTISLRSWRRRRRARRRVG